MGGRTVNLITQCTFNRKKRRLSLSLLLMMKSKRVILAILRCGSSF